MRLGLSPGRGNDSTGIIPSKAKASRLVEGAPMRELLGGASNTIIAVQVNNASAVEWTRPTDWPKRVRR